MPNASLVRFVGTVLVALIIAFNLAAIFGPPDPFSQLRIAGIALIIVAPLAYALIYRRGYKSILKQVNR
ncbi:DUF7534 family protein [Haloprofundus halobius]|uniref:DUF7534 family protein n=1 Tax=Haloprofundus halobius TaxID=2876194 RepID=UPI003CCDD6A5